MDISKHDSKVLKGVAIIALLMLHLFCRKADLPYTPLLQIGGTPLVFYFGLFGDICVPIFCFISGYAHYFQSSHLERSTQRWKHLLGFMINFWLIALIFSILGLLVGSESIPGSFKDFVLNCLTIKNNYNGAWWYVNTYILLILLQPLSYRLVKRCPIAVVATGALVVYTVGHLMRFRDLFTLSQPLASWAVSRIGCFGTSFFPYIVGMIFCKKRFIAKLRKGTEKLKQIYIYILAFFVFCLLVVLHGVIQSLYVTVFTAISVILLFGIIRLPRWLDNILAFLGNHSGNIWLTHMFFYTGLFDGLVFRAKYPVLIFAALLGLSLSASYLVRLIYKPIQKKLRKQS